MYNVGVERNTLFTNIIKYTYIYIYIFFIRVHIKVIKV